MNNSWKLENISKRKVCIGPFIETGMKKHSINKKDMEKLLTVDNEQRFKIRCNIFNKIKKRTFSDNIFIRIKNICNTNFIRIKKRHTTTKIRIKKRHNTNFIRTKRRRYFRKR